MKSLHTRKDYMSGTVDHRCYYAQFVNQSTINHVVRIIGAAAIKNSPDPHFNDIPLRTWDAAAKMGMPKAMTFAAAGDTNTLCGLVCVAKEAAAQFANR